MHPTVGGVVWSECRGAALRMHAVLGVALLLALALLVPSCGIFRTGGGANTSGSAEVAGGLARVAGEPEIRVRLASSAVRLRLDGGGAVRVSRPGAAASGMRVDLPVVLTRSLEGWWIETSDGDSLLVPTPRRGDAGAVVERLGGGSMLLDAGGAGGDEPTLWEIVGRLVLVSRDEDSPAAFDVIEHLGIETYLTGVLAAELPWSWSLATKQAQAVAARSYALHERRRRQALGSYFDVESDTRSQAYAGAATHDRARHAVLETRGLVLVDAQGSLVRAYYSSTCGGRQQAARAIWPTTGVWSSHLAAPLNAPVTSELAVCDDCRASPRYRWVVRRDASTFERSLRAYGSRHGFSVARVGSVVGVEVVERLANGRPTTFEIRDDAGGVFTLTAEHLRQAANTGIGGDAGMERLPASDVTVEVDSGTVRFIGGGFGHGVGLCQFGAEGRADRGVGWVEILRHYYPSAKVVAFYGRSGGSGSAAGDEAVQ